MRLRLALLGLLLAVMPASAETLTIGGEVTYLERLPLPPDGVLRISLVDMAAPDQPRIEAEGAIASPGQVPLTFRFNLDDKVIAPDRQYGLRAEILSGAQLVFRNADPVPVDLAAAAAIPVVVTYVGRQAAAIDTAPLYASRWSLAEIGGVATMPGQSTLAFDAGSRAGGRGGCNSYFTQAVVDGASLAFGPVAATRMECAETPMAAEAVFFSGLGATRAWRLVGADLELLDASGTVVMRLTPSAP